MSKKGGIYLRIHPFPGVKIWPKKCDFRPKNRGFLDGHEMPPLRRPPPTPPKCEKRVIFGVKMVKKGPSVVTGGDFERIEQYIIVIASGISRLSAAVRSTETIG